MNAILEPHSNDLSLQDAPSPEQSAAVSFVAGNAYVGAGPGTGKTFLLVERARALVASGVPPERILVLTFSRRAAAELRERLSAAALALGIEVRTFHGFAARAAGGGLARFRELRLLDGFSERLLLEAAVAGTDTPTLGPQARRSRAFANDLERLLEDLGRAGDAALGRVEAATSPRLRDLLAIRSRYVRARRALGSGDLGDLVARALAEVARPGSPAALWIAGRYQDVLIDEFQDTDRQQLALLEALGARLFAVGDEAQSIYRFRGASDAIVPYALERFAMRRFDLTESRRCPPAVCAFASETPLAGLAPLRSSRATGAQIDVTRYARIDDEAHALADRIEAELDGGRDGRRIAVLVRTFRPLGPLVCGELARRGIPAASAGRDAFLADPYVATLGAALALFAVPSDPARWTNLLASPPLGGDPLAIRLAAKWCANLRLDPTLPARLEPLFGGDPAAARRLGGGLLAAHEAWTAGDLGLCARRVARRLGLLAAILHDAAPAGVRAAGSRLEAVCDGLAAAQRTARALGTPAEPGALAARFEELLASLGSDAAALASDAPGVRVLTVHAAKGLEFERVFIGDAVQGRFPLTHRTSALLADADRALLAAHGVEGVTVAPEAALTEEASLWYVAVTRCSERLSLTFAERGPDGDLQRPSAFLAARTPETVTPVDRSSLLVRGLQRGDAALRARLTESAAAAAFPALAAYARDGAAAFAPCAATPVRRERPFSVSMATEWLHCPRKVYYGRMLELPREESAASEIGSALHRVLRRFHENHITFDGHAAPVEEWTRELLALRAAEWDAKAFSGLAVAAAAARAADAALRAYARFLPRYAGAHPFAVESRESTVRVPAGSHVLEGRVDRVDLLADGTRIVVDYKRGTAKPSPAKVAGKVVAKWKADEAEGLARMPLAGDLPKDLDLQLAFYATALEQVGTVAKIYLGGAQETPRRSGVACADAAAFAGPLAEVAQAALAELERDALAPLAAEGLRAVPTARDEAACEYCPYTAVCPGPAV